MDNNIYWWGKGTDNNIAPPPPREPKLNRGFPGITGLASPGISGRLAGPPEVAEEIKGDPRDQGWCHLHQVGFNLLSFRLRQE